MKSNNLSQRTPFAIQKNAENIQRNQHLALQTNASLGQSLQRQCRATGEGEILTPNSYKNLPGDLWEIICSKLGEPFSENLEARKGLAARKSLAQTSKIFNVHVIRTKTCWAISGEDFAHTAFYAPKLTHLKLTDRIEVSALEKLKNCLELNNLDLRGARGMGSEHLRALSELNQLKTLKIQSMHSHFRCELSQAVTRYVEDDNTVTDNDLHNLAKLLQLEEVEITSNNQITGEGFSSWKELTELKKINLSFCQKLTEKNLFLLAECNHLTHLDLNNCPISAQGLLYVKTLKNLIDLNLSFTMIGDAALEHVKELSNLTHLNLSGTAVTDAGLEHVKDLEKLKQLNLSTTNVSDRGLMHLEGLKNLQQLNLKACDGITYRAFESLAFLCPTLKEVHLPRANFINHSDLQELANSYGLTLIF